MVGCWTRPLSLLTVTLLLAVGLSPAPASAQADTSADQNDDAIAGEVVEARKGGPLPGANVSIKGTTNGTSTDLKGRYRLRVAPGTYDVLVSFVGFQQKTITGVEVEPGQTTTLDVVLKEETEQLDEVVIQAEAARDTDAGLLRERAKAAALSNAVSAEAMGKAGLSNAAGAMKKVTGVSVLEGKYVYIRGMGDRYTNTQLNGIDLPSASADRNAVQFDLFSTNLLDNITVKKTFTPDQPGDFAGGLINIRTESYPSNLTYKISGSTSIGTKTHFTDQFLSSPGGKWDFLAIDDGTRALPGPVRDLSPTEIPTNFRRVVKEEFQNGGHSEMGQRLNDVSRAFNNKMGPVRGRAPVNQSYSVSIGNEIGFADNPLGYLLNVNYGYSSSYYDDGFQGRYSAALGADSDSLDSELLVDESKGTTEAKLGGLLSLNYSLGKNHELGLTGLYSRRGESTVQTRIGSWAEQFSGDPTVQFQDRNIYYTRRQLYSTQLRGEHLLSGLGDALITWNAAVTDTRQEEPDNRLFGNLVRYQMQQGEVVDTTYNVDLTGFPPPRRYFTEIVEASYSGNLDLKIPLLQDGRGGDYLKVGGSYKTDDRTFDARRFEFEPPSNPRYEGDERAYFSDENMGVIDTTVIGEGTPYERQLLEFGNTVTEISKGDDAYEGDRTIAAAYAMADVRVTDWLRVIGGARFERTDIKLFSDVPASLLPDDADTTGAVASISRNDILPSLNLVFEIEENMNIRAAGTQTLARPTFRELAPYDRAPNVLGVAINGNPSLERTLISNVDLRWEWFPGAGEVIALSAFGKDLENAIEVVRAPSTNGRESWNNTDARVYGAELEFRGSLGRFVDVLDHFYVGTNLSLVHSEASNPPLPYFFASPGGGEDSSSTATRPLQGQSPYTFNFDLSYENPETGTNAGLYFNTYGERLTAVGTNVPNTFEKPFHQLNFTFSQRFRDHWVLDLSVENILGDTEREVLPFRGNEFVYQRTPEQRTISIGFSYNL